MASGDVIGVFIPQASEPKGSNDATEDRRNTHPVLDFDASTDEFGTWTWYLNNYAGGGITVYVAYSMSSATSGNVAWEGAFERIGDQQLDVDADSFAAVQTSGAVAVPGTSGLVDVASVAFTDGAQMDSVANNEQYRFRLNRDVGIASNAAGDAEVHMVVLVET